MRFFSEKFRPPAAAKSALFRDPFSDRRKTLKNRAQNPFKIPQNNQKIKIRSFFFKNFRTKGTADEIGGEGGRHSGSELRGVDAFRDKIKIKFGGGNGYRDSKKNSASQKSDIVGGS